MTETACDLCNILGRKQGVGSRLVAWVVDLAHASRCRAAYLHVIDYNSAAMALYWKQGFLEVACRQNFYYITYGSLHRASDMP